MIEFKVGDRVYVPAEASTDYPLGFGTIIDIAPEFFDNPERNAEYVTVELDKPAKRHASDTEGKTYCIGKTLLQK